MLDWTFDAKLESWVSSANERSTDFPIQNLPFGRFRLPGDASWRVGVAIGSQVLDLAATGLIASSDITQVLQLTKAQRVSLRQALVRGLVAGSSSESAWAQHVHDQGAVELGLPCDIRDYTDFYIGIHHATNAGRLFRPDNPLLPNYKYVPIGYHGRASTILASGKPFHRPNGQTKSSAQDAPVFGPTQRLDFELEMGVVIGMPNEMGQPISIGDAESHIFGLTLFNDWSARDIQAWEYQPLGPFQSKNFASTISPWIVTIEALEPFRKPLERPQDDPEPLPYLKSAADMAAGAFDVDLDVVISTPQMRAQGQHPENSSHSNFAHAAYWTISQLVAHHTVGGCALSAGDLFGTGTLSGKDSDQCGSLLEMSKGGRQPTILANGEQRIFLDDGDTITLRGRCQRAGFRTIGFGECAGTVLPAIASRS